MRHYIALIHKEAESDYGVSFPDLPGVISAGATLDEARQMGAEALAQNWDAVAALIPVAEGPPRAVGVNITLPEDALREIDAYAERHGFTRSGFLVTAARRAMEVV